MELFFENKIKEPYSGKTLDNQTLYNFSNTPSKYVDKHRFIVLGSIGPKCKTMYKEVKIAISEMGYTDEVLFIKDNEEILKFGVVNSPALVVDGKVVTYGKQLVAEDVKELFKKYDIT